MDRTVLVSLLQVARREFPSDFKGMGMEGGATENKCAATISEKTVLADATEFAGLCERSTVARRRWGASGTTL